MKLNQKLIQQLRNGEIAVENNGTLEQLREVLKEAFPKDKLPPGGTMKYYKMDRDFIDRWNATDSTTLPTISVADFYQPELFTGWAKDDGHPKWMMYFKDNVPEFWFNVLGEWCDEIGLEVFRYSEYQHNRPATHEEIERRLTEEAIKRGYKEGKTIIESANTRDTHVSIRGPKFHLTISPEHSVNALFLGDRCIFSNGKWAEIIEKPQPNPIHYTVGGTTYSLDYQELKAEYDKVIAYTDQQFMQNLPQIAHLACIVAYFKGLGVQATISDKGIVHELIHLMTDPEEPTNDLQEIREKFNWLIQLV